MPVDTSNVLWAMDPWAMTEIQRPRTGSYGVDKLTKQLNTLLAAGWEPYALDGTHYHLRMKVLQSLARYYTVAEALELAPKGE